MKNEMMSSCQDNVGLLRARQQYGLGGKVHLSKERIVEWYEHWAGQVYVAFSGGKDSTALLHLVRSIYPEVPAVFCNTGLEFPEILEFVRATENVVWLKPKLTFKATLEKYGYPVVSKRVSQYIHEVRSTKSAKLRQLRLTGIKPDGTINKIAKLSNKWQYLVDAPFKISGQCCAVMKKRPSHAYEKETGRKPMLGMMACDGKNRELTYLRYGCNAFDHSLRPSSNPLAFWLEADVWEYIKKHAVSYSKIYDMGYTRTGCVFCAFGAHMNNPNRFELLVRTHPKLHQYCMDKLGMKDVLEHCGINTGYDLFNPAPPKETP